MGNFRGKKVSNKETGNLADDGEGDRNGHRIVGQGEGSGSGVKGNEQEEQWSKPVAKPLGRPIGSGKDGAGAWYVLYEAFEFNGHEYELEDSVLISPEDENKKPYVATIKGISDTGHGGLIIKVQWFFRPEEAVKKEGGNWQSNDARELFYSFHLGEVPAESVMHKCIVHFILSNLPLPCRNEHPGFIVQKIYDTAHKRLCNLSDNNFAKNKQPEIELLIQKTMSYLGKPPGTRTKEPGCELDNQIKNKRSSRTDQHLRETTANSSNNTSKYYAILENFGALTGHSSRDTWLEKLLQAVQHACLLANTQEGFCLTWPDCAVRAVYNLEKVAHESFSSDFQKYKQKMRSMVFNLKKNMLLAMRLLDEKLDPSELLKMSPQELKEGLRAEEMAVDEPEEPESLQMTKACCSRCSEYKVGLRDIIQTPRGDHYQLECINCGHSWYASRGEATVLAQ